jgi:hypothetical protein
MKILFFFAICIPLTLATGFPALCQYDSSFVRTYDEYFFGRFLVNRKTTRMHVEDRGRDLSLNYLPNKTFSVGVGATYKFATLNFSMGLLQPDDSRGRTRNLDIQLHKYGRKITTDLLIQLYKGFYLSDKRFALNGDDYYVRPDIAVNAFGGSFQYVFNHRRFSYRAAFQQTELQKKSAGTLLLGSEVYTGRFRGDSTIIPASFLEPGQSGIDKMRFIDIGPNGGYAYTWVYKKFFVTTAASVSLNASITRFFDGDESTTYVGFSPNTQVRISTGYNTNTWGINLIYLSTALHMPKFEERTILVNTANLRMNIIHRFVPTKKTKRYLRFIDKVDRKIKG